MSLRKALFGFWLVLGLAGLIVVGANVAVSLQRISSECAAPRDVYGGRGTR